jgi:hypothetical protein
MRNTHRSDSKYLVIGVVTLLVLIVLTLKARAETASAFTLGGYAETYFQYNTNEPSNGITAFRGFDNHHDTFTIANVALDASWDKDDVIGRLALQVGAAASSYYLAEPTLPGGGSVNATSAELWKYVQQAYVGYQSTGDRAWVASAGVFLSPIGPEAIAVRDNWNWSRSNLFFGLPFYHTGARLQVPFNDRWAGMLLVCNGWNSVVDNNTEKSVCTQITYTGPSVTTTLQYFGGNERPAGSPEGRPWRNMFDAYATWTATSRLSVQAQVDAGFEDNTYGQSSWTAGALYARFQATERVYLGARVDTFDETVASNAQGTASSIFWPVSRVSSATATVDFRPAERVSFRAEYRFDDADGDMYFGGVVTGDGISTPYEYNRSSQNTFTFGAVTWF